MAEARRDEFEDAEGVDREESVAERPDDLPEGFEHFRFRASPEVAEALRKMTVIRGE